MAEFVPLIPAEKNSDTNIFASIGAGFASGLLKTVEGVVSLGAELVDLGADSDTAGDIKKFFDTVNIFEDAAQDRVAGRLVETFTQIGIPGTAGFKLATKLADKAIKAGNILSVIFLIIRLIYKFLSILTSSSCGKQSNLSFLTDVCDHNPNCFAL